MKKIILLLIIFFMCISPVSALELPIEVTADSVILVNRDAGQVIYSKNPDKEQILASLTKIMTVYTALQKIEKLNAKVTITEKDIHALWGFTQVGLEAGDVVTYQDLLYSTILTSAADSSQALALHLSGSMAAFVEDMNDNAKALGLNHTHFSDTYGKGDDNVSTAREMAILLDAALKNETFERIFNTTYYRMSNGKESINYTRSVATYHGLDSELITGNKSGYTPEAGLLLASTATINDTHYILITMKSAENAKLTTHVLDSWKIYNYIAGLEFKERKIIPKGRILKRIKVVDGTTDEYLVTANRDVKAVLTDEEAEKVHIDYHIVDEISAKSKKGSNLGYVDIYVGDEIIDTVNIYQQDQIFNYKEKSNIMIILFAIMGVLALIILLVNINGFRRRKL